jgi:hypothetical protein
MAERITQCSELSPVVCRREAERRFSSERMLSSYLDLYSQLTERTAAPELQAA